MLPSLAVLFCSQLYFINNTQYSQPCAKAVEATLVYEGADKQEQAIRSKFEDQGKKYISPAVALAPYAAYQIAYKRSVNIKIPNTKFSVSADKEHGQIGYVISL